MDSLTGSVERITYYNPENGYSVVRLKPDRRRAAFPAHGVDREGLITLVGNLPELTPGEYVKLQGTYTNHPKHGYQFQVEICEQALPATVDAIRRYLGSGLVKGIGPKFADRIVSTFGTDTLDIIEHEPEKLRTVPDIGPKRTAQIKAAWVEQKQIKDIMLFLHGHGVSTNLAIKIYKTYAAEALQIVQTDPYRLARDIFGVGFKTADKIAQALGLTTDHPSRLEAGVVYTLNEMTNDGHTYTPQPDLVQKAAELLAVDPTLIPAALDRLAADDRIHADILPDSQPHRVAESQAPYATQPANQQITQLPITNLQSPIPNPPPPAIYLTPLYYGEIGVARRLATLARAIPSSLSDIPPAFIQLPPELSEEQKQAIKTALSHPVSVLTGGPGTGKCVHGDTLVWTSSGLIKIKNIKPVDKLEPDTAYPLSIQVQTSSGNAQTTYFYYGGNCPTLRIITSEGFEIEGTYQHRIIVATEQGPAWKYLSEIQVKDKVAIYRTLPEGDFTFESFAYFLGLFTGDGNVNKAKNRPPTSVVITTADEEIWDFLEQEMPRLNFTVNHHGNSGKARMYTIGRIRRHGKGGVVAEMETWGCKMAKSKDKLVPTNILCGSLSIQRSFLMGLFDTDGTVDKRDGSVELGLSNRPLLQSVQTMLLQFGIVSIIRPKPQVEAWRLSIRGDDARLFYQNIGFRLARKQALQTRLSNLSNSNLDVVPCLGNGLLRRYISQTGQHDRKWWWKWKREAKGERKPHRNRVIALIDQHKTNSLEEKILRDLCNPHIYWAKVTSLEKSMAEVFDLHVPGKNEFIANGFINHNTFVTNSLIHLIESAHKRYALCAPTGRAAKRLSEATGHPAATIHRMLDYSPTRGFTQNEENPLPIDFLVVDEASMLDLILANSLLKALEPGTHLLLVGDVDQLPSVGAGDVLRDVIASGVAPVTRLNTIFRQAAESYIISNAHRINQGQLPEFPRSPSSQPSPSRKKEQTPLPLAGGGAGGEGRVPDFYLFPAEDAESAGDWVVNVVTERIPARFGFDPVRDVQVLAPMYRGPAGVRALNDRLQATLNPPGPLKPEKSLFGQIFRVGDKVMQTQNDYDKEVFNGDIGQVAAMDILNHTLTINFEGRNVIFDWMECDQLTLAYCVSVHKSQGAEFPCVVLPIITAHYMMLQRNLLYTAITRAKRLCVLVGSKKAISMAVRNNQVAERNTALDVRLLREAENPYRSNSNE